MAILAIVVAAFLSTAGAQSDWSARPLQDARRTGTFEHPALRESSGIAPSTAQPGVLWSLSDSDGPAAIFATDTAGTDLGAFPLRDARNVDWEAITVGPCGADGGDCIYIADTGDNSERHKSVVLYRLPELSVKSTSREPKPAARVDRLVVRYPDRPRDVEAAFVDRSADVHLISKGRTEGVYHYRVPAVAWGRRSAVAELVGRLRLDSRSVVGLVTDAALSRDDLVAVRTYQEIYLFRLTPGGRLQPTGIYCPLEGLDLQGEGIGWLGRQQLVTSSEGLLGLPPAVSVGRCPGA